MGRFLLQRLTLIIPVLLGIIFVTFVLVRSIPGDPCRAMLGEKATDAICDDFKQRYGLNDNVVVQFVRYASQLTTLDLGNSIKYGRPVNDILLERLPMTLELALAAMLFAVLGGVPLGIISAYKHKSPIDAITMMGANLGVSIPIFWLGLLLAGFFGVVLRGTPFQLPTGGRLTPGVSLPSLLVVWHLQDWTGLPKNFVTFLSNIVTLNSLLTGRLDVWL